MSRSYKKTPNVSCGYGGRWRKTAKRLANKRVRKANDVPDGKVFKKYYCSWDICDYVFLETEEDFVMSQQWRKKYKEMTDDDIVQEFRRWYVRK